MNLKTDIGRFRVAAMAEAISFLVLLGVAMPFKYFLGMPLLVKYFGWAHGLLFIIYIVLLAQLLVDKKITFWLGVLAFLAALIPFGPFLIDKKIKEE